MNGRATVEKFKETFPQWADQIVKWTPNKDDSVKIELKNRKFYIFTCENDGSIRLESVRQYKKRTGE